MVVRDPSQFTEQGFETPPSRKTTNNVKRVAPSLMLGPNWYKLASGRSSLLKRHENYQASSLPFVLASAYHSYNNHAGTKVLVSIKCKEEMEPPNKPRNGIKSKTAARTLKVCGGYKKPNCTQGFLGWFVRRGTGDGRAVARRIICRLCTLYNTLTYAHI